MLPIIHAYSAGISRLQSYARLRSYIPTLITLPDSGRCHNFGRISRLWLRITTPVDEHAACLTTSAVKGFTWLVR
jgi:hypothetical protein